MNQKNESRRSNKDTRRSEARVQDTAPERLKGSNKNLDEHLDV